MRTQFDLPIEIDWFFPSFIVIPSRDLLSIFSCFDFRSRLSYTTGDWRSFASFIVTLNRDLPSIFSSNLDHD